MQTNSPFQALFVHHDLMMEMGRVENQIEEAQKNEALSDTVKSLKERQQKIGDALRRITSQPNPV